MSKQIKTKYHRDFLQENAASPSEFRKTIKTLFPTKPKKSQAVHYKGVLSETHLQVPSGEYFGPYFIHNVHAVAVFKDNHLCR